LISFAAHAEFTPYASILVGVENGQSFNQGTDLLANGQLQNATLIEDYGSFIGFRGHETIDDQLHFDWQIEQYITADNSTVVTDKNTLANKDSWLGIQGNFGSLKLGRISLLPKSDMEYVDPWEYDGKSVNGLSEFSRLDGRLNNAIKYETPGYFGTKFVVLYSPDEKKNADGKAQDAVNAALMYKDATYFIGYSYYVKNNTNSGKDADVWHRAEIAFDQQIFMLALGYQSVKGYTTALAYNSAAYAAQMGTGIAAGSEIQGTEYSATLNYTFQEKLNYRISYAQGTDMKINGVDVADTGYTHFVVGANYRMSEKSKIFLDYGQTNWKGKYNGTDDKIVENSAALGMSLDI
jgi:predicted porin